MAHIVQVTTFFHPVQGNAEQQILDLSEELVREGHEVTVLCSDATKNGKRLKASSSQLKFDISKRISIKRLKTLFGLVGTFKVYPGLFLELLKTKFDVIHLHGFRQFGQLTSAIIGKIKRKKVVLTVYEITPVSSRGNLSRFLLNIYESTIGKLILKIVDVIICPSKSAIILLEKFNIRKDKAILIPSGITKSLFKEGKGHKFIKDFEIPSNEFRYKVLWIGRIRSKNGLENLETATKQLEDTLFIFAGPEEKTGSKIKDLYDGQRNVLFTGPIKHNDIIHALRYADIFVLPSFFETFGPIILEAMAQGLPIVSTNKGGPAEIIKENFGVLQNPADQWAWMLNIERLLKSRKLKKQMGENARREAEKYKWEDLVYQVLEVYGV
ncbi:glycosyltransferase family 4 protein [Candidatus Dojkabacteria bacterium]|nr:glycosyltransferase family 4 protein [Candidatus Dojkabacteria bacterium]